MRFGGRLGSVEHDETWEWDGAAWQQLFPAPRPPARQAHAMAIPNDVRLVGLALYAQVFAPDTTANAFGWIASNGLAVAVGN